MKDIDININSYLYYVSNALNTFNDIRDLNTDKLEKVYTIEYGISGIKEGVIGYVDIEPGGILLPSFYVYGCIRR